MFIHFNQQPYQDPRVEGDEAKYKGSQGGLDSSQSVGIFHTWADTSESRPNV